MTSHLYTPEFKRAKKCAEEGEFSTATRFAARSAHARLKRFGITRTMSSNLAIGELLYAIYYSRRAGDTTTATHLQGSLQSYAVILQQEAYTALQEEWPWMTWACLVGLFEEWIGDAYLFTEDDTAGRYYDRAESWYRLEEHRLEQNRPKMHTPPCWQWGAEPEFERAWFAFDEFSQWRKRELPEQDTDYPTFCFDRLAYKRTFLTQSGPDTGGNSSE